MPSNHLTLCRPLLSSVFPSIRVFSNESVLYIRWPKYWSFRFSISPSSEYSGFPLGWTGWISLPSKGLSRVFSNTTVQKHINKIDKPLTSLIKKKMEKNQAHKIRNEKGEITTKKYKGSYETTISNYMQIKWTTWKK